MANFIVKIKNSEFGMKLQEKFYPTKKNDPEHRSLINNAMNRYRNCTDKKSKSQINQEIQVCKKYWNCYPHHYFLNDLYRKDKKISDEALKNYIPQFFWYRLFLPHHRSKKFMLITANKIITDQIFKSIKIAGPRPHFYIVNGDVYSPEMVRVSLDQIGHEFSKYTPEKIFFKPADGSGGKGIIIFHKTNNNEYATDQNVILNRDFLEIIRKTGDYIIQSGVVQDSEMSKIYPHSVNTCRIFTENKNGNARVVCAMLRIGRNLSEIDNAAAGGIGTNINIGTGRIGDFALNLDSEKFEEHPDTHFLFRNFKISRWQELSKFATESAEKIPYFTYLGWDIALTANEPVAIELNSNPACDIIQMTCGGLREAFGIEDPGYYWKNPGKRIQ